MSGISLPNDENDKDEDKMPRDMGGQQQKCGSISSQTFLFRGIEVEHWANIG